MNPVARPATVQRESANLLAIKEAMQVTVDEGVEAGVDALLRIAREDCEFRPYAATGPGAVRPRRDPRLLQRGDGSRDADAAYAHAFRDVGDDVVADGTMRVERPTGGFAESQISWTFRFRDGLLAEAAWGPRAKALTGAPLRAGA